MLAFCQWLEATTFSTTIRQSLYLFPILYTLHIFGVVILVGATSALDLRMLGLAMKRESVSDLADLLLPWAKVGFAAQMTTGALLFTAEAVTMWQNIPFRLKMTGVLLAGLNVLIFHQTSFRRVKEWESGAPPFGAKLTAAFSIFLWFGIVTMSRLIAFV